MDKEIKMKQPRVLAVSDMSCFGKCSLTVALPIISSFNIEVVPLPTAILSTHTGEFSGYSCLDMTDEMDKILNHFISLGLKFDCVYTGYFKNEKQLEKAKIAIEKLTHEKSFILVDPVMADNGELYDGFDTEYASKIRSLCKISDVITPNITEAALLADVPYKTYYNKDEMNFIIQNLLEIGCKKIVITGVRTEDSKIGFVCADKNCENIFEIFYPDTYRCLHGCGDVFASALCGAMVSGVSFERAVRKASAYMNECINQTLPDINEHWYGLKFEQVSIQKIFLGDKK